MITNVNARIKYTIHMTSTLMSESAVFFDTRQSQRFYSEKDLRLIAYEENKIKQTIIN